MGIGGRSAGWAGVEPPIDLKPTMDIKGDECQTCWGG